MPTCQLKDEVCANNGGSSDNGNLEIGSAVAVHIATDKDVVGLASDEHAFDASKAAAPCRLVLIDTTELGWQRQSCRTKAHRLLLADPVLVGFTTLQQWLWQRLQIPAPAHA